MNATNQKKVIAAGFTILRRCDVSKPKIKYKGVSVPEWATFENNFSSKAQRDIRMVELLQSKMVIED